MITQFKLRQNSARPKAVIILIPGSQGDGRDMINDPAWVGFAKTHNLDLVGCFFQDDNPTGIEQYCHRASPAFYKLHQFLETCYGFKRIPPLLLWGFSAGGQFAYEFSANTYADLVAGFVVNKGGIYYTAVAPEITRKIPSLWIIGAQDASWRRAILHGIFGVNRIAGATKWLKVIENCGHDLGESVAIGQRFFKGILETIK